MFIMKKIIINEAQYKKIISEITNSEIEKECQNVNLTPTDGQKEAGNYSLGHISVKGMKISIENPKGSKRFYGERDENGKRKYNVMKQHYGYFKSSVGKDGDNVDCFIGPYVDNFDTVYCIDQKDENGNFDETKVMLGFKSSKAAKSAYLSNYEPNWKGFMAISAVPIKVFKKWLYRGRKQRKPFKEYVEILNNKLKDVESTTR